MSQDDLALGARIDRLTRAVEELSARVDRQEDELAARVDIIARRLVDAADRVERGLATADMDSTRRLEQATTGVRSRLEQVVEELGAQAATERRESRERLDARADRLEQAAEQLAGAVTALREVAAGVDATASGLAASASGLAAVVGEVVVATEEFDSRVGSLLAAAGARQVEETAAVVGDLRVVLAQLLDELHALEDREQLRGAGARAVT